MPGTGALGPINPLETGLNIFFIAALPSSDLTVAPRNKVDRIC